MKKSTIPVSGAVVCSLGILIIVTACVTVLVPVVRAEDTGKPFLGDWTLINNGVNVPVKSSPPPFILPITIPVNPLAGVGSYYTDKGCPVGINGAPLLINPNLKSEGLCRGACGSDCPTGRCDNLGDIVLPNRDNTGTCTYTAVVSCPAHQGCQEHDACYDYCEDHGYSSLIDTCHLQCNTRCFIKYGLITCTKWADIPGKLTFWGSTIAADWLFTPQYSQDQARLTFSNFPKFTAYETPLPTPSPTPTPTPTPSPTTIIPTTTHTPTPTPTKTSGPDTRLTIIMTGGLSAEDLEGTTIGWDPEAREQSCSPTSGGAQCILKFPYGTSVVVSAFPNEDVQFIGWFGSCSGSGDCTVRMTKDKTVTAEFTKIPTTTAITNYQDYCTSNYPGSVYDRETQSCVFHGVTPTTTTNYASGSRLTLIPLAGGCCPDEPCSTQIATAAGGTPPYHFSSGTFAGGGAPPMGMIIGLDGYLTGTAPAVGTYSFSVCVADLAGNTDCGVSSIVVS